MSETRSDRLSCLPVGKARQIAGAGAQLRWAECGAVAGAPFFAISTRGLPLRLLIPSDRQSGFVQYPTSDAPYRYQRPGGGLRRQMELQISVGP